jgi:hypothetical protein
LREKVTLMRSRVLALTALSLAASACAAPAALAKRPPSLPAFDSCSDVVQYANRNRARPDLPMAAFWGVSDRLTPRAPWPKPIPRNPGDPIPPIAMASATADAGSTTTESFSTTNNQEAGVDEPDLVKTDGKRMFVAVGTEVRAYDVTSALPRLLGTVDLEKIGGTLLIRGNRLLVIGDTQPTWSEPNPNWGGFDAVSRAETGAKAKASRASEASAAVIQPATPAQLLAPNQAMTRLAEIDVSNPAAMKIVRTMWVPGKAITARATGGTVRIVIGSETNASQPVTTEATDDSASVATRAKVRSVLPKTLLQSRRTNRTFKRALVSCDEVRHPAQFGGDELVTVLTINLDEGLFNVDRDAVLASPQVVYASEGSLYLASTKAIRMTTPEDVPTAPVTEIHRFDASKTGETTYAASGEVPGYLLNQYALSEYQGSLRVASTELPPWLPGATAAPSTSSVTVLQQDGRQLKRVGRVGGLGHGEKIYAVRFMDDVGYVVTFRQVDPLYTLDLKEPTAPKVAGELKITGYSAYLHPLGDDLLLGVGQEASEQGRRQGAQVSVFDVSNPAAPTRLSQKLLGDGTATVEFDPHAFLWWPATKLALVPFSGFGPSGVAGSVVGLRAGRTEGLAEVGRITHGPDWDHPLVARSVVVGDRVLTLSSLGISSSRIGDLSNLGFIPFVAAG